jgi:hypothetical protein
VVMASVVPLGKPGGFDDPVRGEVEALVLGRKCRFNSVLPGQGALNAQSDFGRDVARGRWLPNGLTWRIRYGR